jgi:hypothetical protein
MTPPTTDEEPRDDVLAERRQFPLTAAAWDSPMATLGRPAAAMAGLARAS